MTTAAPTAQAPNGRPMMQSAVARALREQRTFGYTLATPPSKKAAAGWGVLGSLLGAGLGHVVAKMAAPRHATMVTVLGAVAGGATTAAIVTPNK